MYRSVHERDLRAAATCLLYPAHDYRGLTVTSVGEERRFNPRLGGDIGEADFVGYMENLGLPHPKLIDIAVPANLRCGRPEADVPLPADPGWAPLTFTFAGIWEIEPRALEEHVASVQIVDVREPDEFQGSLGHIRGASLIPLGQLSARTRGTLARASRGHGLSLGRTFGAGTGAPAEGRLRTDRQSRGRHVALACGRIRGRRRESPGATRHAPPLIAACFRRSALGQSVACNPIPPRQGGTVDARTASSRAGVRACDRYRRDAAVRGLRQSTRHEGRTGPVRSAAIQRGQSSRRPRTRRDGAQAPGNGSGESKGNIHKESEEVFRKFASERPTMTGVEEAKAQDESIERLRSACCCPLHHAGAECSIQRREDRHLHGSHLRGRR